MDYALNKLKKKLALPVSLRIEFPPHEIEADLSIPSFKENPKKIADKIKKLKIPLIEKVEVKSGYVNLTLHKNILAKQVFAEIKKVKNKYGWAKATKNKVLIEYSSPNIAKPMHIGHLRNTVIGNALKNIYKAVGYKVISANYIGDWGTQFGLMLLAYKKEKKWEWTLEYMGKQYAKMANNAQKNPKLAEEARELFSKLEKGDKDLIKIWKKIRKISLREFKKIYKELGVSFDFWNGESFYKKSAKEAIKETLKKKVAHQEKGGPVVVEFKKDKLPSFLLEKADGATLYAARDLAAAKWRLKKYNPESIIYITGQEQELYFKQIFKTLELIGYPTEKLKHIGYNLVTIKGKKASTRAGRIVFVKDILKESIKKIKDKKIAYGAVIYNTISQKRNRLIEFDWKKVLNLQGNSAPYIQYGYVRAQSILKKAKTHAYQQAGKGTSPKSYSNLNEREGSLVMLLAKFPEIIKNAQKINEPHLIANYLNTLVQVFNRFYESDPIIKAEKDVRIFRLELISAVSQTIKNGLELLGIQVPKKM